MNGEGNGKKALKDSTKGKKKAKIKEKKAVDTTP